MKPTVEKYDPKKHCGLPKWGAPVKIKSMGYRIALPNTEAFFRGDKVGDYCMAIVPDGPYAGSHPCTKSHGLKRYGRKFLCAHHRPKGGK